MREIKYRGLSKNGWEYGLPYFAHGTGCWKITRSNGWQPSYSNPDEGESTDWIDVDANTISQFTGLKDKNGTEIHEGDIYLIYDNEVNDFGEEVLVERTHLVKYSEGVCSIGFQLLSHHSNIEVVGNIHENPELLTKNQ